jgi:hypothetical protein
VFWVLAVVMVALVFVVLMMKRSVAGSSDWKLYRGGSLVPGEVSPYRNGKAEQSRLPDWVAGSRTMVRGLVYGFRAPCTLV